MEVFVNRKRTHGGPSLAAAVFACLLLLAAGMTARAAETSYTVRSEPFADRAAALKLSSALSDRGYHPVIETGRAAEGEFYFLQMGTFANLDTAMKLVLLLKGMGYDFLCLDNTGARIETTTSGTNGAALISPKHVAELFPGGKGEPALDQWSMLEPPPKKTVAGETPPTPGAAFNPKHTGPRTMKKENPFGVPELTSVQKQLRDLAWDLRGKGFEAYFDKETYIEPTGVLAGIFDTTDEAEEFASELKSYGYDAKTAENQTPDGTKYYVYADVDDLPSQMITTIDNTGNTTESASSDALMRLKRPKKDSLFKNK